MRTEYRMLSYFKHRLDVNIAYTLDTNMKRSGVLVDPYNVVYELNLISNYA